eukprot:scaffold442_cov397-Prasinococcus_capsulatus_cf.AAC.29
MEQKCPPIRSANVSVLCKVKRRKRRCSSSTTWYRSHVRACSSSCCRVWASSCSFVVSTEALSGRKHSPPTGVRVAMASRSLHRPT